MMTLMPMLLENARIGRLNVATATVGLNRYCYSTLRYGEVPHTGHALDDGIRRSSYERPCHPRHAVENKHRQAPATNENNVDWHNRRLWIFPVKALIRTSSWARDLARSKRCDAFGKNSFLQWTRDLERLSTRQ
ncbi:MAG: hypothetical protein ABI268_00890 [Rhodanobacter sp.]